MNRDNHKRIGYTLQSEQELKKLPLDFSSNSVRLYKSICYLSVNFRVACVFQVPWIGSELKGNWSDVVGRELYTHEGDDGTDLSAFENTNIADSHSDVCQTLSSMLRQHFQNDSST